MIFIQHMGCGRIILLFVHCAGFFGRVKLRWICIQHVACQRSILDIISRLICLAFQTCIYNYLNCPLVVAPHNKDQTLLSPGIGKEGWVGWRNILLQCCCSHHLSKKRNKAEIILLLVYVISACCKF